VALTVRDLEPAVAFYRDALGLVPRRSGEGAVSLLAGPTELVALQGDPSAARLDRTASGLFHLALRFATRSELAAALVRFVQAGGRLDGASDHLVSEALYLHDPEGNGIELYWDRPRSDWPVENGQLQMATLPLDLQDLLGELEGALSVPAEAPAATVMGHVHLQVAEIAPAETFWHGVVGFDVTVGGYPGALFVSAGGYHHHLGLNTWNSRGQGPAVPGSVGLRSLEIVLPDAAARDAVLERVRAAGVSVAEVDGAPLVRDPSGNAARLVLAG
jgi:catechol 2,3-dioxygenase